ncbi:MAG: L-threonine 3-dehydrogenase [Deltaproteobacteria bacterium]|nr:L-threonine 3-dehydrogenase [Deltaproteobacteria bacterium]MBW2121999.1 L-threonine 3-dehydrogenase [Deltaproteobacteria bacterium]
MKAIVKARPEPGGLEFRDVPVPEPGFGEVLLKNRAVAICGTDLHIYNWDAWSQKRVKIPTILGHEFAADVVGVGQGVKHVKEGQYVSGEGHLVCGFCDNCRTGKGHVCYNWKGLGYDVDGAFREYFVMPEVNIWENDPETPAASAAIQDPLGNAVHTVFCADCVGKTVAVYGLGAVGLLAVATLKAIGAAEIFAFGRRNEYRLDLARKLGAHHVIKTAETDPVDYIKSHTGGVGVDVAMEIAGTTDAILAAIRSVKMGGDVVLLGIPNKEVPVDFAADVVFRAVSIHGITGRRIWDTWFKMKGLLKSGSLNIGPVITHRFPFDEYERGFELMKTGNCGKVVLEL